MRRLATLTLLLMTAAGAAAAAPGYDAIRGLELDGRKIDVGDLTLSRDAFTIRLTAGKLHLLAPIDGKTLGAVFLGTGRWELLPATEGERRYLAFRRGVPELKTLGDAFDSMVLFFNDETMDEALENRQVEEGVPDARAAAVYAEHLKRQREEWKVNLHLRLLRAVVQRGSPFYAFVNGKTLPPAMLAVDPVGILDGEETALWVLSRESGGFLYSSHRREEIQAGLPAGCPRRDKVVALHYEIDTRVNKNSSLEGVTKLRFRTLVPGVRFVPLQLLPTLRIREAARLASDGESTTATPVEFLQEGKDDDAEAALVFPEALPAGEEITVRLGYSGDEVLENDGDGNFQVRARDSWYPNLGFDWATYDLTFRVPPKKQVVSVGHLISTAGNEDGTVSVWKSDVPIRVAGFNYGEFRLLERTEKNSGVKLQIYTNPGTPDIITEINAALAQHTAALSPADSVAAAEAGGGYVPGMVESGPSRLKFDTESLAQQALADAVNSIQVYTAAFGPLPHDRIAITQQSAWGFGQSWPTLIFLPYLSALSATLRQELGFPNTATFEDQVGLHEMAHQWWGNRIGQRSYRDQWIEEGFAEFSAALALQATKGRGDYDKFWERARRSIVGKSPGSTVRNFEAGPLTLGFRLATPRSPAAYDVLAYSKGAYVLHMLRMMLRDEKSQAPDERFFGLLRSFVHDHDGRAVTTEDFKAHIESHLPAELNATKNGKLDWFFDQWVYGTEIPRYVTKVDIDRVSAGKWHLHGTIAQEGVSERFLAIVPLYLEFDKGQFKVIARPAFKGTMTQPVDVTLDLPDKPRHVRLNVQHEVLAMDEP